MRILLAVNESQIAVRAADFAVRLSSQLTKIPYIVLLNVDEPLPRSIEDAIGVEVAAKYHADNGEKALETAKKLLSQTTVAYEVHMLVGDPAETIVKLAVSAKCDLVIMGSHGDNAFKTLLLGSVTTKVLAHCQLPVTIVR